MFTDIFSLPLSALTKIHTELNEGFFTKLLAEAPEFGKPHEKYWLINNHLTLHNPNNLQVIAIFNTFVNLSRGKCKLLQITKN